MKKTFRNPKVIQFTIPLLNIWLKIMRKRWDVAGMLSIDGIMAQQIAYDFKRRIADGEELYLVGLVCYVHNSGAALIKVSERDGIQVILNNEEERYRGIKHYCGFPTESLKEINTHLKNIGLSAEDIFCFTLNYDWLELAKKMFLEGIGNFPESYSFKKFRFFNLNDMMTDGRKVYETNLALVKNLPNQLRDVLGLKVKPKVIYVDHHDSHAYFSYAVSPFNSTNNTVAISVVDGTGNSGPTSLYSVKNGNIKRLKTFPNFANSLGYFYASVSSLYGGWSILSSEGRYMGAAGWGDMNRSTNTFYKKLKRVFHYGSSGSIVHNRDFYRFHQITKPFTKKLIDIVGLPLSLDKIWNPDAVLTVNENKHSKITKARVDTAAAMQLVFEDALFHTVDYLIKSTESDQLILSGGTALNCLANMHLLEHFDSNYYKKHIGKATRLNIWVPPIPSDQGTSVGSAFRFAMGQGIKFSNRPAVPYLCGLPPKTKEVIRVLRGSKLSYVKLGNVNKKKDLLKIADLMAWNISKNRILGIFQGSAETGPRALGNRSFLANPCNPKMLQIINDEIKFRERIRPLAPMVTIDSAKKYFHLSDGAKAHNYDAYNYMVLTARAKAVASKDMPAVIHADGTSRIQIVREEQNPLIYQYLKAMRKHCGVEVSVNTSLNIGGPIVQTPKQAIDIFNRAKGLYGMVMVGDDGDTFFVTGS